MCWAVLVTDVKHSSAPAEWYWPEKLILRAPTEPSLPALGINFVDWGSNSLLFYRVNLETQTKSTEHPFQEKIVPVSYCLLSLFQTLNLLRIKAIYNSCQGKYSFPCWINLHWTHLAQSGVAMSMNPKTPRLHVPSQSCMDTTLHEAALRGYNRRRAIKAHLAVGSISPSLQHNHTTFVNTHLVKLRIGTWFFYPCFSYFVVWLIKK